MRLAETEPESLLYAGLELRCGVESRMRQYLETQTSVSAKLKKGYQIAKLARGIEAAFRIGEKYVRFTVEANDHEVIAELWHTPVTAALRKNAEWCGNLLHAQRRFRQPDDSWWSATRERLQQMAAQLALATRGELIGAPLRSPAGQIELSIEYPAELALHDKLQVGSHHTFRVRYLASPPPSRLDR